MKDVGTIFTPSIQTSILLFCALIVVPLALAFLFRKRRPLVLFLVICPLLYLTSFLSQSDSIFKPELRMAHRDANGSLIGYSRYEPFERASFYRGFPSKTARSLYQPFFCIDLLVYKNVMWGLLDTRGINVLDGSILDITDPIISY